MITKSKIRALKPYLQGRVRDGEEFYLLAPQLTVSEAQKAGFTSQMEPGETVLPAIVGPSTRRNAEGEYIPDKTKPKVSRYLFTKRWTWQQWEGRGKRQMEDYVDVYRDVYQQEFFPPSGIELSLANYDGKLGACSPLFTNGSDLSDANAAANVLLELFGRVEILSSSMESLDQPKLKTVNWRFLPPGQYPWDQIKGHLDEVLSEKSDDIRSAVYDRQETILKFEPDEQYVGRAGFSEYVAYVFPKKKIAVLESIMPGNALYLFADDWATVSRLSKSQVIEENLHLLRIIHSKGWKKQLAEFLGSKGIVAKQPK